MLKRHLGSESVYKPQYSVVYTKGLVVFKGRGQKNEWMYDKVSGKYKVWNVDLLRRKLSWEVEEGALSNNLII